METITMAEISCSGIDGVAGATGTLSHRNGDHSAEAAMSECDVMLNSLHTELSTIKAKLEATLLSYNKERVTAHKEDVIKTLVDTTPEKKTCVVVVRKKRKPQFTAEQQQHYINLVNEREKEITELHNQCKGLMEIHVSNQLQALKKTSEYLARKLNKRLEKEKNARILRKPVMQKSDVRAMNRVSKSTSSVNEAAVPKGESFKKEFITRDNFSAAVGASQQTMKMKSAIPRLPNVPTHHRRQLLQESPHYHCYSSADDIINEYEDEPSNSWAITGMKAVNNHDQAIPNATPILSLTPSKPPEFVPIKALLGEKSDMDNEELQSTKRFIQRQLNNRQQLVHVFKNAKLNQQIMTRQMQSHNLWNPVDPILDSTHQLLPVAADKNKRVQVHDHVINRTMPPKTATDEAADTILPSLVPSLVSQDEPILPSQLLPLPSQLSLTSHTSADVPLTIDQCLSDMTSNIKEAKQLSSLWTNYHPRRKIIT